MLAANSWCLHAAVDAAPQQPVVSLLFAYNFSQLRGNARAGCFIYFIYYWSGDDARPSR
jgi:hypothetical protein